MGTAAGIGDGNTAPLYNGTSDYCNIYSTTLATAFNGAEGTVLVWARVSGVGVWTDGAQRQCITIWNNINNRIQIIKAVSNNTLAWSYVANGTVEAIVLGGYSSTDWMCLGLTWSATDDQAIAYYNGTQAGTTQTTLGAWVGTLASTTTVIGAGNITPTLVWSGYLSHGALFDSALSPAAIADLAVV